MRTYREILPVAMIVVMAAFSAVAFAGGMGTDITMTCLIVTGMSLFLYIFITFLQRRPHLYNNYRRIKPENRPEADRIIIDNIFTLKTLTLAMLAYPVAITALGRELNNWVMATFSIIMLAIIIRFIRRINRL